MTLIKYLQEIYLQATSAPGINGSTRSILKVIAAGLSAIGATPTISALLDRLATLPPKEVDTVIHKGREVLWPNKAPLTDNTLRNYRSVLATMAIYAAEKTGRDQVRPMRALLESTGKNLQHRAHVDHSKLSQGAIDDIEKLVRYKTTAILPPNEIAFRGDTWRPNTADLTVSRLRSYWARMEMILGRESTRVERFSPTVYTRVIGQYLEEGEKMYEAGIKSFPGYTLAKQIAIHLQVGCREFLRTYYPDDFRDIEDECSGDFEQVFNAYRDQMDIKQSSVKRGRHKTDTTELSRVDLHRTGQWALEEAGRIRAQHGNKPKWLKTELRYRRGGLFLIMLTSWGMRIRNAAEMRWTHNIKLDADGRWSFRFSGDELKIGMRGKYVNVYEGTFGLATSVLFSEWRDYLESVYDPEITRVVPFVFPTNDDLRAGMRKLRKERGQEAPLHPLVTPAFAWLDMSPDDRKAAATTAAQNLNLEALWHLTAAHTYLLNDARDLPVPKLVVRDYHSVRQVLETGVFNPLLDPPEGSMEAFTAYFEEKNHAEDTIRTKHIGARHLFRALRWAGATEAYPYSSFPERPRTGKYVRSRISAKDCLRDDFIALFMAMTGIRLTPHRARNILSGDLKSFGQRTGHDAWSLASERLGNHPLTVYREYNDWDTSGGSAFDAELDQ